MSKRPKIAFWFRYGPAAHSELFHALPSVIDRIAAHADVLYYGMQSDAPLPESLRRHAAIYELPLRVRRASVADKFIKTTLWLLALPGIGLHCRLRGVRAVYIDETIPLTALIARVFFGRNVAITVADFFTDIYFRGCLAKPGKLIRAIDLATWRYLPLIFTRAVATRAWLAGRGIDPDHVYPVYDPCDLTVYHPLPADDRARVRQAFGYAHDDIVLVHHGILHPNKGNDRIIRAMAELRPACPRLRYLLIGDGPDMGRLQRLIESLNMGAVCRLTGWLPTPRDVNQAINAGDIGLVMRIGARSDNFHVTGALVHSMACGLPVLAADLGGIAEIVRDGDHGWLFDPSDMDTFKARLLALAGQPETRARLGAAALRAARSVFDVQQAAGKTAGPLLRLAGIVAGTQAVILLGGRGTRLASVSGDLPKCLVPLAGKPFLAWQLQWLRDAGFDRVHLAAGYRADRLQGWLQDNPPAGLRVTVSVESEPLGTGGALRHAAPWITENPFFVLNGDSLTPALDFAGLLAAHQRGTPPLATLAVVPPRPEHRFGTLTFDRRRRITGFHEKDRRHGGWINTGVYCMMRGMLDIINPRCAVSLESDVFPTLAADNRLRAHPVVAPLLDMGTPEGYAEMQQYLGHAHR